MSEYEKRFVEENHECLSVQRIARELNRNVQSIKDHLYNYGYTRAKKDKQDAKN